MGTILFVIGNLFAFVVADSAAALTVSGREPWRRALATVAGFPIVVLAVVLVLGNTGFLFVETAVSVVAAAAVCLAALRYRRFGRAVETRDQSDPAPRPAPQCPTETILRNLAVILLGVFGGVLAVKSCVLGTSFFSDDLSFHATVPAHWLADGAFSLVPFSWHAYHPYNAETLAFWFVLPFHGDAFASLAGLYWIGLALAAVVAIGKIQGHTTSTIVASLALLTAVPAVVFQTQTFSAVDLAAVAALLAAVPFAISSPGEASTRGRAADAAYCGLLAGFATGCKVSFAPAVFILLLWWLCSERSTSRRGRRIWNGTIFLTAVMAAGAHWYVRALLVTGNPLFPGELGPFDGPLTSEIARHTRLISRILAAPGDLQQWSFLIQRHLSWPLGMALLTFLGYAVTLRELRRKTSAAPATFALRLLLVVVGLTLLCLYPLMPMSGSGHSQSETLRVSLRYVLAPFVFGFVLFPTLLEPERRGRALWWAIALLAAVTAWPGTSGRTPSVAVVTGLGALAAVAVWRWVEARSTSRSREWFPATLVLAVLVLLAAWSPFKQRATDAGLYRYSMSERPVGVGWRALEQLPDGARVAAFESHGEGIDHTTSFFYYPAFGRNLTLVPVFVAPDGSQGVHLHERWENEKRTMWEDRTDWDLSQLTQNLATNRVEYVLISKLGTDEWPPQQQVLVSSGRARVVYDDAQTALWQLTPAGG